MESITLTLSIRPLSYNQYYRNSKTGKRIKTGPGLAYDEELTILLESYQKTLKRFAKNLDPSKVVVEHRLTYFNPEFFIQDESRLNMTSGDIDNPVKVLQDKIFKAMGQDDYFVKKLFVEEYPSDEVGVVVDLIVRPMPEFLSFKEFKKSLLDYDNGRK